MLSDGPLVGKALMDYVGVKMPVCVDCDVRNISNAVEEGDLLLDNYGRLYIAQYDFSLLNVVIIGKKSDGEIPEDWTALMVEITR